MCFSSCVLCTYQHILIIVMKQSVYSSVVYFKHLIGLILQENTYVDYMCNAVFIFILIIYETTANAETNKYIFFGQQLCAASLQIVIFLQYCVLCCYYLLVNYVVVHHAYCTSSSLWLITSFFSPPISCAFRFFIHVLRVLQYYG